MPLGADIICLPMACLCLALCERGKARGAQETHPTHCHAGAEIPAGTVHTRLSPKLGDPPVRHGRELPKPRGYSGMLRVPAGDGSSMDCCWCQGSLTTSSPRAGNWLLTRGLTTSSPVLHPITTTWNRTNIIYT